MPVDQYQASAIDALRLAMKSSSASSTAANTFRDWIVREAQMDRMAAL